MPEIQRSSSLDELIADSSAALKETLEAISGPFLAQATKYRSLRASALASAGSIIIPTLLALATLVLIAPTLAVILSLVTAIAAGVLGVGFTAKIGSLENK